MPDAAALQNLIDIGASIAPSRPTTVAAAAAVTQAAVTDALDGATLTGTALTTSATPTVDELETNDGVLGAQLNAALADIAAVKTELAALRAVIANHGFIVA